jgi:hypothetical protein
MWIMEPELMHAENPTDNQDFMNQRQRDYFRQKLLAWKNDLFKEANATLRAAMPGADLCRVVLARWSRSQLGLPW